MEKWPYCTKYEKKKCKLVELGNFDINFKL